VLTSSGCRSPTRKGGYACSINNRGQIVGFSDSDLSGSDIHKMHALLWEDGRMIELQTQIPNNSGWKLRRATGINDQGQITGFGQFNGKMRAFLLTPTVAPQPNVTDSTDPNASAAKAATNPQQLWPAGAKLSIAQVYYQGNYRPLISWPIANGADHYRVTEVTDFRKLDPIVWLDVSPVYGTSYMGYSFSGATVTVTAYSGPDEATAYSESIHTHIPTR
jgi:probable HAF family extracellular repeat protein